jgi:hypothetical protein
MTMLAVLLALGAGSASVPPTATPTAPPAASVAVVASLSGGVARTSCGEGDALRRFDWLAVGCRLEVAPGARVVVAFADGTRYELGERARATIAASGLRMLSGPVHPLEPYPPMPRVVLSPKAEVGPSSGAVRIRDGGSAMTQDLEPRTGATTLAAETMVLFARLERESTSIIEIEDEGGQVVLMMRTELGYGRVPNGVLKPGARYWLRVRGIDARGATRLGQSIFTTLNADDVARREALKRALDEQGGADALALLGAIDRRLGLLREARDELRAALARSPDDAAIREALQEVEEHGARAVD